MNREHLPANAGMLFVFDPPRSVSFWMRNTLIPLDMIFLDREGVVQTIHENAVPLDETPIPGGDGIYAVLEINGGLSRELGIVPGSEMRHPVFGGRAEWSCGKKKKKIGASVPAGAGIGPLKSGRSAAW